MERVSDFAYSCRATALMLPIKCKLARRFISTICPSGRPASTRGPSIVKNGDAMRPVLSETTYLVGNGGRRTSFGVGGKQIFCNKNVSAAIHSATGRSAETAA